MKSLVDEVAPIFEAVNQLKDHVVKGRKPRENPTPVNPNKIVKTCQCCFRGIAVLQTGNMAQHGYRQPTGAGYRTSPCSGHFYKPLEVSNKGVIDGIKSIIKNIKNMTEGFNHLLTATEIDIFKNREIVTVKKLTSTDDEWKKAFSIKRQQIERELRYMRGMLKQLVEVLRNWKPEDKNNCEDASTPELMDAIHSGRFEAKYIFINDHDKFEKIIADNQEQGCEFN